MTTKLPRSAIAGTTYGYNGRMPIASLGVSAIALATILPLMSMAADFETQLTKQDGIDVIRLVDNVHNQQVTITPGIGNMATSYVVKGHEILWLPTRSLSELQAHPALGGIPFLAPWANRIDGMAYWANGKKYLLNGELGNLRLDPNQLPIHGLLAFSPLWKVVAHKSDGTSAEVTSRLEFYRYPDLMAQFPFAHTIDMTYRLHEGRLDVETVIHNLGTDPMPVAVGFHPYFRLTDTPRNDWTTHIAATEHQVLNDKLTPTGERKKLDFPDPYPLAGHQLDDGFATLVRDENGLAHFWVKGKSQQITVSYGRNYTVAVAYAPPGREFICFEPMSAVTNGFNLAHAGKWNGLQSVAPGGEWSAHFEVRPSGF